MITDDLGILSAEDGREMTLNFSQTGKDCKPFQARAFLKNMLREKFLTEVLTTAATSTASTMKIVSEDALRDCVFRFAVKHPTATVVIPYRSGKLMPRFEPSPDAENDVLHHAGYLEESVKLCTTSLNLGRALFLQSGWLTHKIKTELRDTIGRDGQSYNGRATIRGAWNVNPALVTQVWY